MLIDFNRLEENIIPHFYGGEKEIRARMHMDAANKIMLGSLPPGASVGLHTHEASSELVYVLDGSGTVVCDGEEENLRSGLCHYCPKGHSHSILNSGDIPLVFFAVVPQQ